MRLSVLEAKFTQKFDASGSRIPKGIRLFRSHKKFTETLPLYFLPDFKVIYTCRQFSQ